jgi:putative ABC transport system permease protein
MMSKNLLTKGLIVLQFALAIFLIIGTIAVNSQVNYLLHTDLGYDTRNLVRIDLPNSNTSDKLPALFKNELANQRNILTVAARNGGRNISGAKANGKNLTIEFNKIDEKYLSDFKIPIIAGRNFSPDYPADSNNSVIVNESFVKEAGWKISNAVGQTINFMDEKNRPATIVGVIRDYHFVSLKEKITPELFSMDSSIRYGQVWVKIDPNNVPQTLALLESTFKKIVPFFPYSYQFMDDINAKNYETQAKWKQIISIASGLFVFISCIGLLGLVMLSIEQRTKEIGIRKVLGAAVSRIMMLISKEFVILILIAFAVATPVGYYFIHRWLQDFAYRINISWWMFPLAGVSVIIIALMTLSYQAIKAAFANPAKSLRTE